jgi:hypothetical protein
MSKISLRDPFGHLKHKLWPKERPKVKLAIWLPTTKSRELTRFPCVQVACNISLKIFWQGLQLFFKPHFNRRSARKVIGPQSRKSPNFGNFKTPIWVSRIGCLETKWHLGAGPIVRHRVYYKGEGGGFPQVRAMVNFVNLCLLMTHPCTKVL